MHRSGVPLKVIQKISGHKTLSALQKYLEVLDEVLESAISTLNFWGMTAPRRRALDYLPSLELGWWKKTVYSQEKSQKRILEKFLFMKLQNVRLDVF